MNGTINRKIKSYVQNVHYEPSKYSVYIKLLYMGTIAANFDKRSAVEGCFPAIQAKIIFTSQLMLQSMRKDVLPTTTKSMLIYKFFCGCGSSYVGRTTKCLRCRTKEHVPLSMEKALRDDAVPDGKVYGSAIAEHLIKTRSCGANYTKDAFTMIDTVLNKLQLNISEALHIMHDRPVLCIICK